MSRFSNALYGRIARMAEPRPSQKHHNLSRDRPLVKQSGTNLERHWAGHLGGQAKHRGELARQDVAVAVLLSATST